VFDEKICREDGDGGVGGDDHSRGHRIGDGFSFFKGALSECDFADLGEDYAWNDEVRQFAQNGAKMADVGAGFEAFEPSGGVENVEFHW